MRNFKTVGFKALNKVFADYPNCYFPMHDGLSGTAPTVLTDEAGTSLTIVPQTTTTAQWTTKPGWWSCTATNAADHMLLSRATDPTNYDLIFNMQNTVMVQMMRVFADTDPTVSGRFLSLGNLGAGWESQYELKYLTGGVMQGHWEGSSAAAQIGVDLPSIAAPNESVLAVVYDSINQEVSLYCYTPATKSLQVVVDTDTTVGLGINEVTAVNQQIAFGATPVTISAYGAFGQNLSIRDYRAINFGATPPADLSEIIEELAINSLAGTRR